MENIIKQENIKQNNATLSEAYKIIHQKEPQNLEDWEIAKNIIEVLNNKNWIDPELAEKCANVIRHEISYPNEETKNKILIDLEDFLNFKQ